MRIRFRCVLYSRIYGITLLSLLECLSNFPLCSKLLTLCHYVYTNDISIFFKSLLPIQLAYTVLPYFYHSDLGSFTCAVSILPIFGSHLPQLRSKMSAIFPTSGFSHCSTHSIVFFRSLSSQQRVSHTPCHRSMTTNTQHLSVHLVQ
jgi:hypothetical protein